MRAHLRTLLIRVVIFASTVCVLGEAQQEYRNTNPVAAHAVIDLGFSDQDHGWAVVWTKESTSLLRTHDAGRKWRRENGLATKVWKAYFLDARSGWAVGEDKGGWHLYGTQDGGAKWSLISTLALPAPTKENVLLDMRFLNSQEGWFLIQAAGGGGMLVLKTIDGGQTTQAEEALSGFYFKSAFAAPNGDLWLVGLDNSIAKKSGSKKWQFEKAVGYGMAVSWSKGVMLSATTGFLAGQGPTGTIVKTEDGGKSWRPVLSAKSANIFFDISFIDANSGCAVGAPDVLYCTSDAGEHWIELYTLPKPSFRGQARDFTKIMFLNRRHAYLIRDVGYIYESTDGGKTWVDAEPSFGGAQASGEPR